MTATVDWTTPTELRRKVRRLWDRGTMLASLVTGESLFPKRLSIRGPNSAELAERFEQARNRALSLRAMANVRLEEREFRHRLLGSNSLPRAAWLDSMDHAVALLGKARERAQFEEILEVTRRHRPLLLEWLGKRPLVALEHAQDWEKLLDVVTWIHAHPRPGI